MWLLIDGYNVLFAAGILLESRPVQPLEPARQWLLRYLTDRVPVAKREGIVVVFDAKGASNDRPSMERHDGITVLFAQEQEEADDLIEQLIRRASVPARVTVVSTDRRLREVARRRRAQAITSEAWLETMDDQVAQKKPSAVDRIPRAALRPSRDAILSADEVDHWLTTFEFDVQPPEIEIRATTSTTAESSPGTPKPPRTTAADDDAKKLATGLSPSPPAVNGNGAVENPLDWSPFPVGYGDDVIQEETSADTSPSGSRRRKRRP